MLDITYVIDEVRRGSGGIQLPAPTEVPPWTEPLKAPPPLIRYKLTVNPPNPQDAIQPDKTSPPSSRATDGIGTKSKLEYTRLAGGAADNEEIRLLRLLPGKGAAPLKCELVHVPLASPGEYDALSYCWGQPTPTPQATLHCNGLSVSVTSNLADALSAFRLPESPRSLWVDALCINQEDLTEKEHQVPLMGRIYRGASAVRIWLGNDTPSQPLTEALGILRNVHRLCVRFGWDLDFCFILFFDRQLWKESGLPDIADDAWRSVKHLIQMPWFSRTWIIQEVVLSRGAYLHSNSTSLPWTEFCIGFLVLTREMFLLRVDMVPTMSAYAQVLELILSYHKARVASTSLKLLAFLENHRVAHASDPRDKIYAFLGMHEELAGDSVYGIVPSYLSSVREVYVDVAMKIIQHAKNLDVLGMAGKRVTGMDDELPSWVPDWSKGDLTSALSYKTIDGTYLYDFNATVNTSAASSSCPAIFEGDQIQLNGFCFDEVATVGDVADVLLRKDSTAISVTAVVPQTMAIFLRWLRQSGSLEHVRKRYPDGRGMLEAFMETIFLENIPESITAMNPATGLQLLFFPSQVFKQQRLGEDKLSIVNKIHFLFGGVSLRLVGAGGFQWLARAAKRIEDRRPLNIPINGKYAPASNNQSQTFQTAYVRLRSLYRRLFVTKSGYMGMANHLLSAPLVVVYGRHDVAESSKS